MQAEPVSDGSQGDDGGPTSTTATGGVLDGTDETAMGSGGGSSAEGTTMAGTTEPGTTEPGTTEPGTSTDPTSTSGSSTGPEPSGCMSDEDCTRPTGVCDTVSGECVVCLPGRNIGCPTGVCTNGGCVTLGYDCLGNSNNCNAGEQCCGAAQCAGDCMIACGSIADCPATMGCEHGWCLFPCANNNADCAAWPGYTCQHSGTLCETD